jgi:hypothetical protein
MVFLWRRLAKQKKVEEGRSQVSSAAMDDISEISTTCSSEDQSQELEPLLWVSQLRLEAASTRQFALTIGRSSTRQQFGLAFKVKSDGKIIIAEDALHYGILKGDVVIGINGSQALTPEQCQCIVRSALEIEVSLLSNLALTTNSDGQLDRAGKPLTYSIDGKSLWTTRRGLRCIDLLAVSSQYSVSDRPNGQFNVRISRASCHLKFGLKLTSLGSAIGNDSASAIFCAEDLPHLGLREGDQVLSLNGVKVCDFTGCRKILDSCMSIELLVRRHSTPFSDFRKCSPGLF